MAVPLQLAERVWQGERLPFLSLRPMSLLTVPRLTVNVELVRRRPAVRRAGHPRLLYGQRAPALRDRVHHDAVVELRLDRRHVHFVWHPQARPVRTPPADARHRPTKSAPIAPADVPRHHVGEHGMDQARPVLEQHVGHLRARHGGCLDARVFLGPQRGSPLRADGSGSLLFGRRR